MTSTTTLRRRSSVEINAAESGALRDLDKEDIYDHSSFSRRRRSSSSVMMTKKDHTGSHKILVGTVAILLIALVGVVWHELKLSNDLSKVGVAWHEEHSKVLDLSHDLSDVSRKLQELADTKENLPHRKNAGRNLAPIVDECQAFLKKAGPIGKFAGALIEKRDKAFTVATATPA